MAAKWLFAEEHAAAAAALRTSEATLHAPDLLPIEVANVVWKKARAGEIPARQGPRFVRAIGEAPLALAPSIPLLEPAWEIAAAFERSVYDALYVALALALDATLVTADRSLVRAFAGTRLASRVRWIGDPPGPDP